MKFLCSWLTHRIDNVQLFPNGSIKVKCRRCNGYFILNKQYEVFMEWNERLEFHYSDVTGARTIL